MDHAFKIIFTSTYLSGRDEWGKVCLAKKPTLQTGPKWAAPS